MVQLQGDPGLAVLGGGVLGIEFFEVLKKLSKGIARDLLLQPLKPGLVLLVKAELDTLKEYGVVNCSTLVGNILDFWILIRWFASSTWVVAGLPEVFLIRWSSPTGLASRTEVFLVRWVLATTLPFWSAPKVFLIRWFAFSTVMLPVPSEVFLIRWFSSSTIPWASCKDRSVVVFFA